MAFAVLVPVALLSAWIRGTVLSTNGYVAAVAPVAASPAVRAAVQDAVTAQVDVALSHAEAGLPPAASVLAGPLNSGISRVAGDGISAFMASPAFRGLWVTVNKFAHSQLISVLNGDSTLVTATHGEVALNLVPLINEALHDVSGRLSSATGGAITLPPVSGLPAAACNALAHVSHGPRSATCAQVPLFPAAALAGPRQVYRIVNVGTALALILTAAAFAGAVAVAPRRARVTLLQLALAGTITALAARIAVSVLDSTLIAKSAPHYQAVAGVIVHAVTSSFFTLNAAVLLGGLALAVGTLLAGPYRWATRLRAALRIAR